MVPKPRFSRHRLFFGILVLHMLLAANFTTVPAQPESTRMDWWREARFGMFIHWGLYAIPAGQWDSVTTYGEWIRTSARIPLEVYDTLRHHFNPVKFNASAWVRLAKDAGARYIVITTKHHDGFCLFDSKFTDFDVMSTPFQRDIMKEISEACRKEEVKICWYHSIMDWHHPDYLPRRPWETERPVAGADFQRYRRYLKDQLRELLTNYGPIGVLWFDGEWENTWNTAYGKDLYAYVRSLQPNIIINNRVGAGRSGMEGFTKEGDFAGDFATPEQEIPARGVPGVDWETCMTMNDHWGYNRFDSSWKSTGDLIRKLADIASKGGNFLLNVGPTAEGLIPAPSVERLQAIGRWMRTNGESIYGTSASPFQNLPWGRCTQKPIAKGTRLYLHVFHWPLDGLLAVPGIYNTPRKAYLLADAGKSLLRMERHEDDLIIRVPLSAPDTINTVVVLDLSGRPDVNDPPTIKATGSIFLDSIEVHLSSEREGVRIRYTLDGSEPSLQSPLSAGSVILRNSSTIAARCFRQGRAVSPSARAAFTRVHPQKVARADTVTSGLTYAYYEGTWEKLPSFDTLKAVATGVATRVDLDVKLRPENFALVYQGFVRVPQTAVYRFGVSSDDGSRLFIDDQLVADNDGLHGMRQKEGEIALEAGLHRCRVDFFQGTGDAVLEVRFSVNGGKAEAVEAAMLMH